MKKSALGLLVVLVGLCAVTSAHAQVVTPLPPDPTPVIRMGVDATPFAPDAGGYPMTITMTNLGPRRGLIALGPLDMGFLGTASGGTIKSLSADGGFVCYVNSSSFGCRGSLRYGSTVTIKAIVKPDPCSFVTIWLTDYLVVDHRWNGDSTMTVEMVAPCSAE